MIIRFLFPNLAFISVLLWCKVNEKENTNKGKCTKWFDYKSFYHNLGHHAMRTIFIMGNRGSILSLFTIIKFRHNTKDGRATRPSFVIVRKPEFTIYLLYYKVDKSSMSYQ